MKNFRKVVAFVLLFSFLSFNSSLVALALDDTTLETTDSLTSPTETVEEAPEVIEEPTPTLDEEKMTVQTVEPQTATINATKIVCDSELDLPNWGAGGHTIDSDTASSFLDGKGNDCHLQSGWEFEWGAGAPDGGADTLGHVLGYTPFSGPTNVNGVTIATVPVNQGEIHVREVLRAGYIPFTGQNTTESISAEFYCSGDTLNYDNWDFIRNPVAGTTYDCVAFNVKKVSEEPQQCNPEVNLIQNGDFEAPVLHPNSWDIISDSNPALKWLVAWVGPHFEAARLGLEIQRNTAGAPFAGNQHAELDGDSPVTIWQDIPTIVGKQYDLTFKYSPRPIGEFLYGSSDPLDNALQVQINDTDTGALISGTTTDATAWTTITRSFVATSTTTKVEIMDKGTDNSVGGYIDNVSLNCNLNPAPQCNATATSGIVSDVTTKVGENNAVPVTTPVHNAWTASIPDATWIWSEAAIVDATVSTTKTFTKTFNVVGTPLSSSLKIAADNDFDASVNGVAIPGCSDVSGATFASPMTCAIPAGMLTTGSNTLSINVTNLAVGGSNASSNPAGLLYKLTLNNNECVTPKNTSTVTMCKTDDSKVGKPLLGWTLMLKGDSVQSGLSVPTNVSTGVNSNPLVAGASYIAKAVGTWLNQGGANPVDAEYSTTDGWATHMDGYTNYQTDILELQIDNKFDADGSNWGAYNTAHTYAKSFVPASTTSNFRIFDGTGTTQNEELFGDNKGSLSVDINKGYAGVTGEDGCVTFTKVPYGTYSTDEIMQDGWSNVYGIESVTVNEPTEKFTLVNKKIETEAETTITVTKVVVNSQVAPSTFPLFIGETSVTSGVSNSFAPGSYVVSETNQLGFIPTFSGACIADEGNQNKINGIGDLVAKKEALQNAINQNPSDPSNQESQNYIQDIDDKILALENSLTAHITLLEGTNVNCTITNTFTQTNSAHTTVVKAGDLESTTSISTAVANNSGKWFFYNDTNDTINNSLGGFVTGPAVAPIGTGSAEMVDTATDSRIDIATYKYQNTKLGDIKGLAFSAYSHAGVAGPTESPYLVFNVSFDGSNTWQKRLVYVPGENGAVPQDAWNTYDTINAGSAKWTWSGYEKGPNGVTGGGDDNTWPDGNTSQYRTWAAINSQWPNARFLPVGGLMGVRVGEPGPQNYVGNVDKFVIGIKTGLNTHTETYDFEPTVVVETTACSDGLDNDKDGLVDANDPGCMSGEGGTYNRNDTDETNSVVVKETPKSTGPSGGSLRSSPQGQVLGATTTCGIYVDKFLRRGYKNDVDAVMKLQKFLNDYMKAGIKEDGKFGLTTEIYLKKFQTKHADKILAPWGFKLPTGIFYLTTQTAVNNIMCPDLKLSIPTLTPIETNPLAPKKKD